jgi:hypothetical protein
MSEISVSLGKEINERDIKNLRDSIKDLTHGDRVVVRLEAADAHEAGAVTDELARQGFDYQPHGGNGTDFYFTAEKVK